MYIYTNLARMLDVTMIIKKNKTILYGTFGKSPMTIGET